MIGGTVCIVLGIFFAGLSMAFYLGVNGGLGTILGIFITILGFIPFVIGIILLITAKGRELNSFDERMEKRGYRYTNTYGDFLCNTNRRIWWKRGVGIVYNIDDVIGVTIEHSTKDTVSSTAKRDNYSVIISTTNISAPVVEIDCGKSAVLAENIKSTIVLLLNNTVSTEYRDSISN